MSDRQQLQAVITAVDKASPVFKQVATGAETMGKAVDQAGKTGAQGLDGLSKGMEQARLKGAALGALFRETQGVLTEFARRSNEQAASQTVLQTAIENTGHSLAEYHTQIDAATATATRLGFNNNQVRESLAVLTTETRDAGQAMEALSLVEDLARARNLSLEQSTLVVTQALSGNVGALRQHGIMLDLNASKEEILAALQVRVGGQAEAAAETQAGTTRRLTEEFHNFEASVGGAMGALAPYIALLPGLSEGYTLAAAAGGSLIEVFRAEKEAATAAAVAEESLVVAEEAQTVAATEAGLASTALDVALGPLGLVLAATAAGVAIFELVKHADHLDLSVQEAGKGIGDFVDTIAKIGPGAEASALADYVDLLKEVAAQTKSNKASLEQAGQAQIATQSAIDDATRTGNEAAAEAAQQHLFVVQQLQKQLESNIITQDQFNDLQSALLNIFADQNPLNIALVTGELARLRGEYESGKLSADDYVAAVVDLDKHHRTFGLTLDELSGKASPWAKWGTQADAFGTVLDNANFALIDYFNASLNAATATDSLTAAQQKQLEQTAPLVAANTENAFSLKTVFDQSLATAASMQADADAKQAALVQTADLTAANTENAFSLKTVFDQSLQTSAELAKHVEIVKAWAEAHRGAAVALEGTVHGVGDVLAVMAGMRAGLFTAGTALLRFEAGSRKASDALGAFKEVQDGLIGREQVFSQQASEYSQQVNAMAAAHDLLAQRQTDGIALTKDQTQFMKDYDEALGRVKGGVEDATIAEGILAEQYALNMKKGDELNASLDGVKSTSGDLTQAIRDLIATLEGVPPKTEAKVSAPGATQATEDVQGVHAALNDIPGLTTPSIGVLGAEDAIGIIHGVSGALAALDGQTAVTSIITNNINNIINSVTNTSSGPPVGRLGGVVGHRLGGQVVPVELAEAGPELLHLRGGGAALIRNRGIYGVPVGSYVDTADATAAKLSTRTTGSIVFNHYGDVNGVDGIDEMFAAMARAARTHFAGLGV